MASHHADSDPLSRRRRLSPALVSCLALGLVVSVVLPGCGGCGCWKRSEPKADQRMKTPEELEKELEERRAKLREEERKKRPNIEFGDYVSLPYEPRTRPEGERASACFYKPGHWTGTMLSARANHFDVMGDLETLLHDGQGKPLGLVAMPYTMVASRRVALAKGQPKTFQSVFFAPVTKNLNLSTRLVARKGGRGIWGKTPLVTRMAPWQYHFVVLARFPENYAFLKGLDSVKRTTELTSEDSGQREAYYRINLLNAEKKAALPSGALFWTSTAYVLWDDASPEALSLDQQVALVDWLHWGGQLILSGPDTLDTLRHSFLADYLPAESQGTRNLREADLEELNRNWTIDIRRKPGPPLVPVLPMTAVTLKAHPQARFLAGTGDLVVERRIGRGRIVVTAFPLSHRNLTTWPSFDGFFNGCILRRPRRVVFQPGDQLGGYTVETDVTWAGDDGRPNRSRQKDSRLISNLRYFSRDTGPQYTVNLEYGGGSGVVGGGVGAWSDFNSVASACREALHEAAQIEIPDAMFLVWVMSGYLIVLVPVNWFVFRLIDRVEWAWAAAPVIAIGCAMLVIHLARLDIGFARSRTEIGVVEMQGDYPRAHVSRYTVLYSSLTTRYRIASEDPGAQIQPFPTVKRPEDLPPPQLGERLETLPFLFGKDVSLDRFQVISNSTGYVHCEQMVDTGGPILLQERPGGGFQVINRTGFTVHGAGVVRKTDSEEGETGPAPWETDSAPLEIAWLGTLEPEATADFQFRAVPSDRPPAGLWPHRRDELPLTASEAAPGGLNLRNLIDLAEATKALEPGDVRLIGWIDEPLGGIQIKPAAPQSQSAAVLVAHLQYGPGPEPKRDVNSRYDFDSPPTRVLSPESLEAQSSPPAEPQTPSPPSPSPPSPSPSPSPPSPSPLPSAPQPAESAND